MSRGMPEERPADVSLDLSVVTMLFRSERWVPDFYRRIVPAAEKVTSSFEIVFVDDGSPDRSAELVRAIAAQDPRVVLVELSRNFGHHPAAVAGLRYARGRKVFIIDVDLEEQPEWLPDFVSEFEASTADVVFGESATRRGTIFRRLVGGMFWRLFNMLSETTVPLNPCTVRVMSRRYVDALLTLPDRNLFLAGNYAWLGFRQVARRVEKGVRPVPSSYTLPRLLGLFLDAITSFTSYPLRLIFLIGLFVSASAIGFGTLQVVRKLANPAAISLGWSSIMVSIWLIGGVIIAFLGVIGIYLSKIFNETKGRPLYVVREVTGGARFARPDP